MASIISAGTTSGTALNVSADTTGDLAFQTKAGANTITVPNLTGTLLTNRTAGSVVQVVSSLLTQQTGTVSTNSISFVTTGHTLNITPTSSTNKILLMQMASCYNSFSGWGSALSIFRNGSNILTGTSQQAMFLSRNDNNSNGNIFTSNITWLDSPATTSSVTYTVFFASGNTANTITYGALGQNVAGTGLALIAMEIAA